MTDGRPRLRRSVFARVVVIMTAMAVCLLLLVSAFFWLVVARDLHALISKDTAHAGLLTLLLLVIVVVVVTAHAFLRHLLHPLRSLSDGVTRLGEGELDVQLPPGTGDEFGMVTDAFNRMVQRVGEMVGARDRLLIDVSHELRSPLTRMKVTLELLPADAQRVRLAADVAEMERMVGELLELERLRARGGLRTARVDLVAVLRDVVARGPQAHLVVTPDEIWIEADDGKIRSLLRNLLDNAAKYSEPRSGPVEISAVQGPESVVVRITDDGMGIAEEDLERVFEPFYRVDRSRSKDTGGYGLGLSICKRVMEAHGGSIVAERIPGRGASFVLTFPKPS